ncbi:MAG: hypothetical protein KC503_27485, partial [Myxococcales bacterium]|nr:hypothetical protein [Myxococcales bacterium]
MKAFITAALLCTLTAAPASAGPAPAAAPALAKPTLTKPLVARTIERLGASAHVNACLALGNAAGTYAATRGGLLHVDGAGRARLLRLRGLGTRTHALLRVGSTLWVGGERGLARLQLGSRDARAYALRTRAPVRTMIAVGGTLYVGTWGDGLW